MLQHGFISYCLLLQSLHGQYGVFGANLRHLFGGGRTEPTKRKILWLNNQINVFSSITDDDKGDTKVEDLEGDDMKD